jgi:Domain of unknown function (DUF1707)
VASLLRENWVAGRLSVEQLEQRLAGVMAARNQFELSGTLTGLPLPPYHHRRRAPFRPRPRAPAR